MNRILILMMAIAVAVVLSNWENVLRAIGMASSESTSAEPNTPEMGSMGLLDILIRGA